MKSSLQHIIEDFSHLPLDARRDTIARRVAEASSNLEKGAVKKGSVKDLYKDIENG